MIVPVTPGQVGWALDSERLAAGVGMVAASVALELTTLPPTTAVETVDVGIGLRTSGYDAGGD